MKDLIRKFPDNLLEGLEIAKSNTLKKSYPEFNQIVICGLVGSGIGGV